MAPPGLLDLRSPSGCLVRASAVELSSVTRPTDREEVEAHAAPLEAKLFDIHWIPQTSNGNLPALPTRRMLREPTSTARAPAATGPSSLFRRPGAPDLRRDPRPVDFSADRPDRQFTTPLGCRLHTTAQEVADARQNIIDRVGSYIKKPSEAFRAAVQGSPDLILHPDALNDADQLVEHRWRFAEEGAKLLARYAASEELGPLREWKQKFAVDFAANGRVSFKYRWTCKGEYREGSTEWHLKEGDNTTKRSAARIYFARVEFEGGARIVVLYVGPHPEDGERTLVFTAP